MKKSHPDKNKNVSLKKYEEIRTAIKEIATSMKNNTTIQKNPKTFLDLKKSSQQNDVPIDDFLISLKSKNPEDFNKEFNNHFEKKADYDSGFSFQQIEDDRINRTKHDFLNERVAQDKSLTLPNLFKERKFDNNVFQNIYETVNKKPDTNIVEIKDNTMYCGLKEVTINNDFTIKQSNLSYNTLFSGNNSNIIIDDVTFNKYKSNNIINPIMTEKDRIEMKQKANIYKNFKPEIPTGNMPQQEIIKRPSEETINNNLSKKLFDRSQIS